MPNRVIRGDLLDSEAYGQVGDGARLLFVHLILLADDLGCVSLAPLFLRRRAFLRGVSQKEAEDLLGELESADLVRPYESDRGRHGFIPRFRQRLQRNSAKCPLPPASLYADDAHATALFARVGAKGGEAADAQPVASSSPTDGKRQKRSEQKRNEEMERASAGTALSLTSLPDEWRAWCVKEYPNLDTDLTFEKFRDYWSGVPGQRGRKSNWLGCWKNWCRNERTPRLPTVEPNQAFEGAL